MNTPILLITFNRPQHTRRVLESILNAHPLDLYVFQDGAREDNLEDSRKCAEVRQVVADLTKDTDVVVHTNYSEKNLGCGRGPATGITWFFSQVEMGIVMEDDCLPHPDFFGYCNELLNRYKLEESVRFINSTLYNEKWKCEASYGFSHYMVTGAWAGWKRTWEGFDLDLKELDPKNLYKQVLKLTRNRGEAIWWYSIAEEIKHDSHKKSYWDYQMQIKLFLNEALTIHPCVNLISNIGFDESGTHTIDNADNRGGREVFPILPLTHPINQLVDPKKDAYCWAKANSRGIIRDHIACLYQQLLWSDGIGHRMLMGYKRLKGKGVNSRKV